MMLGFVYAVWWLLVKSSADLNASALLIINAQQVRHVLAVNIVTSCSRCHGYS